MAACADLLEPSSTTTTADLVILGQQADAPTPGSLTFWVSNAFATRKALRHDDGFSTVYVEVFFPRSALASIGGTTLGPNDSVEVAISARAGGYGLTLAPAGLDFTDGLEPTAAFSFGLYGDASVAAGDPSFPDTRAYLDALTVWAQTSAGTWREARTTTGGVDQLTAVLEAPGAYVVAARR